MHLRWTCQYRRFPHLAILLGLLITIPNAVGAETARPRNPKRAQWHVTESTNFRVLNYGLRPIEASLLGKCEKLREQLCGQWLEEAPALWRPKCDVVLHSSDASYEREVGAGGRNTIASALVDRRQQEVSLRRIDVRATRANWQQAALAHELTHVVLAERFAQDELPRWVDEGIAILADSQAKRNQHALRAGREVSQGSHFALAELLLLEGYPPTQRWGAFYDQSAALVEFLVAERGHQRLLKFVDLSHEHGYDYAFQQVYAMSPVELERRWHASLSRQVRPASRPVAAASAGWIATDSGG